MQAYAVGERMRCALQSECREDEGQDKDEEEIEPSVAWAKPSFSKREIDLAGDTLIATLQEQGDLEKLDHALEVVNNWRAAHSFPLNTFQTTLRRKARQVDSESLVAQRLKRLFSIQFKLRRFKTMKLTQMQDIGGCRAVVSSKKKVFELVALYTKGDLKHQLHNQKPTDYIEFPKPSGYRSVHLVYRYNSDKMGTYNGQKVEVQIRTALQHAWATAVETVDAFTKQALKASLGQADWERFFILMGSAMALRERAALVPNTPTRRTELVKELRGIVHELDVIGHLRSFKAAITHVPTIDPGNHYYLLRLDPAAASVSVQGYSIAELNRATDDYLSTEKQIESKPGADAVLISVDSIEAVRKAYPNYFMDTDLFIKAVEEAIS